MSNASATPIDSKMRNLKRDITVILSIKVSIVLLAAFFVFGSHQRPRIDDDALNHQILNDQNK